MWGVPHCLFSSATSTHRASAKEDALMRLLLSTVLESVYRQPALWVTVTQSQPTAGRSSHFSPPPRTGLPIAQPNSPLTRAALTPLSPGTGMKRLTRKVLIDGRHQLSPCGGILQTVHFQTGLTGTLTGTRRAHSRQGDRGRKKCGTLARCSRSKAFRRPVGAVIVRRGSVPARWGAADRNNE
ncbi:hypothetical protein DL93DRAFT_2076330 [Clavulina sp. PMI_390]|nr:hypothetical protein DL93DRAFT_2076330 [Clavulina sp. PMI_390]